MFRTFAAAAGAALLFLVPVVAKAADAAPAPTDTPKREMTIQISERISRSGANAPYERIARVFPDVFEARHWPFTFKTERLAAGTEDQPLELKVYFQGIRQDVPGELVFRAWLTLLVDKHEYDFGIVRADYSIRPGRFVDDLLDDVTREAAIKVAEKVEGVLFKKTEPSK